MAGKFQTRSATLSNVEVSNCYAGYNSLSFGISYSAYHPVSRDTVKKSSIAVYITLHPK